MPFQFIILIMPYLTVMKTSINWVYINNILALLTDYEYHGMYDQESETNIVYVIHSVLYHTACMSCGFANQPNRFMQTQVWSVSYMQ